jgi:hypothetical protein
MTIGSTLVPNSQLSYTPPAGTVATIRNLLRSDIYWHDGIQFTAWDAAFSFVSLIASGAPQLPADLAPPCPSATCVVNGVKILSNLQFDINLNSNPASILADIGSLTMLPGHVWSSCPSSAWKNWSSASSTFSVANTILTPCIGPNVTASGVILPSASAVNPAFLVAGYDPIANGKLVGSGPWMCRGVPFGGTVEVIGGACVSTKSMVNPLGTQNPPIGGSYTFQRFGKGFAPGQTPATNDYFRSSGTLALWLWSGETGDFAHDFTNYSGVVSCFAQDPAIAASSCSVWEKGVGNPFGSDSLPQPIGIDQVSLVQRFVNVNWIAPFVWASNPPLGIVAPLPLLYAGSPVPPLTGTLSPSTMVGCANSYATGGGYNC